MLKPIRTKKEYKAVLERIYELTQKDLKKDTDDYNELDLLSILVEKYEEENYSIN